MMERRGQIAIFAIVGIIILAVVILFLLMYIEHL